MQEHNAAEGGFALAKIIASPGVIGVLAGAVGFMFLWPKTPQEGFARLATSGMFSHFFGNWVVRAVVHYAEWIPIEEVRAGAYLLAGLPGWFILGAAFKYFKNNEDKDLKQIARDVANALKDAPK